MNLTGKYKKIFLIILSFLYILLAVLLITTVVGIYREGIAAKAVDPLQWIYSESRIAESLRPILPLFFLTVGASVIGLIMGIKDEKGLKPVKGGKFRHPDTAAGGITMQKAPQKTLQKILLIIAVILIAAGVYNGSAMDVFGKAVKICTECVGIG